MNRTRTARTLAGSTVLAAAALVLLAGPASADIAPAPQPSQPSGPATIAPAPQPSDEPKDIAQPQGEDPGDPAPKPTKGPGDIAQPEDEPTHGPDDLAQPEDQPTHGPDDLADAGCVFTHGCPDDGDEGGSEDGDGGFGGGDATKGTSAGLPFTGVDSVVVGGLGSALLATGVVTLVAARRRTVTATR
jgi:hypothetical protein